MFSPFDEQAMCRALELARQGAGSVEPNPLVGCVIASAAGEIVGEGWHAQFGGPHAEVAALAAAGDRARGGTLYVTLEPCCHHGKTPPCTQAIAAAGVRRVVAAVRDPFPMVAGKGLAELAAAGIEISSGVLGEGARRLNAPYFKRVSTQLPWVIAKWAMTLDGKIATRTGDSQWISGEDARREAHRLRGLVDAIVVGYGTCVRDNPRLTARPPGPRIATRIVLDSEAALARDSYLAQTAREVPVIVVCGEHPDRENMAALQAAGCELLSFEGSRSDRALALLKELGRRGMTNVLVEGGSEALGAFHDGGFIDEVQAFVAPRLIGGRNALSPMAGDGVRLLSETQTFDELEVRTLGDDVLLRGRSFRHVPSAG